MISGIDEAGRGCVIGPLVMTLVSCPYNLKDKLYSLALKDSKLLSYKRRAFFRKKIENHCEVYTHKITAKKITYYMGSKISLNEVEAKYAAQLISKTKSKDIYIDCPDTKVERFKERLKDYIDISDLNLIIEHKADYNYKIVSAASIIAKQEREKSIAYIKKKVSIDFGSGYSSDPITRNFLKKNINNKKLQPYLRHRWKTVTRLKQAENQTKLF